jgi:hypothetical protein
MRRRCFHGITRLLRPALAVGLALTLCISGAATSPPPIAPMPLVIYTDIVSGPNSGGENDKGIYLSLFGKNLGDSGLGTKTKVYIGEAEVDNYRYLGPSKGRPDIQQISVQVGALGNPKPGTALPIKVVVDGRASNTDLTFMVSPGNIYFVDNVSGVDTVDITTGGSFAAPFRTVQKAGGKKISFSIDSASFSGAWGRVRAGDFMVMRGTGKPWTDLGFDNYFMRALNKSGCPIGVPCAEGGGTSSGAITLMGYPGEDAYIYNPYKPGVFRGALSSASSARIKEGKGSRITVANLRIEGGNDDGVVNTQLGGSYWRIVNNELTAATAVANLNALAGGIVGSGAGEFWVGNHIHAIYQGPAGGRLQNHGIYVGDDPVPAGSSSYEIAYNLIKNIPGGNGFQIHVGGLTTGVANNVNFHHNIIDDVGKHGINLAEGTQNNILIWNNLVYNTTYAGIRMGGTSFIQNLRLFNNTFYNTNTSRHPSYAAFLYEMNPAPGQFDVRNNIFVPASGTKYYVATMAPLTTPRLGSITNNLWFGGTGTNPATSFSSSSLQGNPQFISTTPGSENFRLRAGSPAVDSGSGVVSSVVKDDHEIATATLTRTIRPQGKGYDIGAYEFNARQ